MKKKILFLGAALAVASQSGLAAGTSQGDNNGKPFQELNNLITENRLLIESNKAAIDTLNTQMNAINTRLDGVDQSIGSLETRVNDNTVEITKALEKISTTESNIQVLQAQQSELIALAAEHDADLEAINAQLADIKSALVSLNAERQQLADSLNAQLAVINANVADNSVGIDALVLDLVTINARLTSINSSIMTLNQRQTDLTAAQTQYTNELNQLKNRVSTLESSVTTLFSFHLYTFQGIRTNLPISSLNGWTECYRRSYADMSAHPENMVNACTGSKIMLACRATGSNTLTVAAFANREDVFFNTGDGGNVVHTANGVDWYFSYNYSMGFAPVGQGVQRSSADVQNTSSNDRLSWHTHDSYTGGFRCGSSAWLNNNSEWEKVIYQAN